MDLPFRQLNLNKSSEHSDPEILKCPFLRNINEPTNFSFTSPTPRPACNKGRARGPIFEDGPNFDMAFSLFHGRDGVVPLSGNIVEEPRPQPALPHFNPLAADAATISLSSFGSFCSFSNRWIKQERVREPFKKGNSMHEAMSNERVANGSCPIAKSYRAVGNVIPLVAKALQPPPGMKLQCPPAIIAKTGFAKNMRPQPLPAKVFVIWLMGMAANVQLGIWREHTKKFSFSWFDAVPFIAILRKSVLMPKSAMAFAIGASILGQVIGSRAEQYRLQTKSMSLVATLFDELKVDNGHCCNLVDWNPLSLQTKPGNVFCCDYCYMILIKV